MFRTDALCTLVATSAFGEGVNIPNIRHAVLYNLPFNEVEFNQMCGRIGRDGQPATIHLLFERDDRLVNDRILNNQTPDRDLMAQIYRCLRTLQRASSEDYFCTTINELAEKSSSEKGARTVGPEAIRCGIAVFRELGLIDVHTAYANGEAKRSVHVPDSDSKVALADSVRYREGLEEIEIFHHFSDWALGASVDALRRMLIKPILPGNGYKPYAIGKG